ncbi:MAG: outer membrane protein assembly factor BamE [Ahrensia sp.]|nr:outer membrane protein assembly factor BamE [Ahrensia sp.]
MNVAAKSKMTTPRGVSIILALTTSALVLSGCNTSSVLSSKETFRQGFVIDQETLALVPVGSSREQVLLSLGSPTTTNAFNNNEQVFYYISQTRVRNAQFLKAKIVDQRVLAVYFDQAETVERIADYGLKDGKVFDFVKRATPTGGKDSTFLAQIFSGGLGASASQVLGR